MPGSDSSALDVPAAVGDGIAAGDQLPEYDAEAVDVAGWLGRTPLHHLGRLRPPPRVCRDERLQACSAHTLLPLLHALSCKDALPAGLSAPHRPAPAHQAVQPCPRQVA